MPPSPVPPGTLPRPGPIGRSLRIVLAALLGLFVFSVVRQAPDLLRVRPGWRVPGGDWWLAALACLWALPQLIDGLSGHRLGRSTQGLFLILVGVAVIADRVAYGALWGAPVGLLVLLLFVFVAGASGVSFLVAAIAATPG